MPLVDGREGCGDLVTGRTKLTARDAFDLNIKDAETLVSLAKLLANRRTNRMRSELRARVGIALGVPKKRWGELECLENDQVFVTFKPGSASWRDQLNEAHLRPLLRQSLVAACAAVETFCADRVMERYANVMAAGASPRLLALSMTVQDYLRIEKTYERRAWGLRNLVELEVRRLASPAPAQIGELFALLGERGLFNRIDARRGAAKGSSTVALDRIVERRNLIAHTGDRKGRGRAAITVEEVEKDLAYIASIVAALDAETARARG